MSDPSKAEGCSDVYGSSELGRPPKGPHQLRRIGNWKHISSISASSIHRNPTDNADAHKKECAIGGQSLLAQYRKSKVIGMGKRQMFDRGSSPVMSDAVHSVEGRKGAMDITGDYLRKEKSRAFESEGMVLSRTSVCRMESSSVDWKNVNSSPFFRSGIVSSEWKQCAEFNVNHKTQNIVQSKRKYGCWDERLDRDPLLKKSEFASSAGKVKSMAEEFRFREEYVVQRSRLYRFVEKKILPGYGPLQKYSVGSTSGYGLGGLSPIPDALPSVFTRDESIHSATRILSKEKLANHNCLNLENDICESHNHPLFTFSHKKRDESLTMGCSRSMPSDQSPKSCCGHLMDASGSELLLTKKRRIQQFTELDESFGGQHLQGRVPGFSIHEAGPLGRCTITGSVGRPVGISINDEKVGRQSIDASSAAVQNESPAKTACLDVDAHMVESLPEGVTSVRSDKKDFIGVQNLRKSESTSSLQVKEAITSKQKAKLLESRLDFSPCIGTMDVVDPKGLSMSGTAAMELDHVISQVEKPEKYDPGQQTENHVCTEECSRWVKRFTINSDSIMTGTMDYKMEDVLTTRKVHKLLSRVMNYSRSNSFTLAKCLQERQQFQKTVLLLKTNDSPVESLKESHPWIRRWCAKSEVAAHSKTRKPKEVLYEPEKAKPLPEDVEGKLFPSLSAMALMGKAINNFRPCEIRRRGSSLVWNTEGFQRPECPTT